MIFRLRAFGIHLLATCVVLTVVLGGGYLGWYAWPAWYLEGAEKVVGLVVLIALVIGPLATLMVSSPKKAQHLLRLDWTVIAVVQIVALAYGSWTLWQGRPLFYAFSVNQMELVSASQFDNESMTRAQEKSAKIMPSWSSLPQWVWAPLPENEQEATDIIYAAITSGKDVTSMPEHFRPWAEGLPALRTQLQPMPELREKLNLSEVAYTALIKSFGKDEAKPGWILIQGGKREGIMVFERETGKSLSFLPMPPK